MRIPVFLSAPRPFLLKQHEFLEKTISYLIHRGLEPRTLGMTDYDTEAPLKAVRRLMLESNGLISIAFRRTQVIKGITKPDADMEDATPKTMDNTWFTSPWTHIEAAMAYQMGLPILVFREKGVVEEGILEKGVVGLYLPVFDVNNADKYFDTIEWSEVVGRWEGFVRSVVDKKGNPPQLY